MKVIKINYLDRQVKNHSCPLEWDVIWYTKNMICVVPFLIFLDRYSYSTDLYLVFRAFRTCRIFLLGTFHRSALILDSLPDEEGKPDPASQTCSAAKGGLPAQGHSLRKLEEHFLWRGWWGQSLKRCTDAGNPREYSNDNFVMYCYCTCLLWLIITDSKEKLEMS